MSRLFREAAPTTPPPADPNQRLLGTLLRRQDEALMHIDRALAANRGNPAVTDVLLDVRNLLSPPA